jgi:hypothetical protein
MEVPDEFDELLVLLRAFSREQEKHSGQIEWLKEIVSKMRRRLSALECEHRALHLVTDELFLLAARRDDDAALLRECFDAVMARIDQIEDAQMMPKMTEAVRAVVERSFSSFERRLSGQNQRGLSP